MDPQGRYVFVKFSLWGMNFSIANLYLPHTNQISSALRYMRILSDFTEGKLILGRDFNAPLDQLLDSSTSSSSISFTKLRAFKRAIYDLRLIDIWQVLFPKNRNYTHFSQVHHSYSLIHYLLIDHSCLIGHPNAR